MGEITDMRRIEDDWDDVEPDMPVDKKDVHVSMPKSATNYTSVEKTRSDRSMASFWERARQDSAPASPTASVPTPKQQSPTSPTREAAEAITVTIWQNWKAVQGWASSTSSASVPRDQDNSSSGGPGSGPRSMANSEEQSVSEGSQVGREKIFTGDFLGVDTELLRSISLQSSLRYAGRMWRSSPMKMEEHQLRQLHAHSRSAEGYEVFFSHTWTTPGRWKFLSLLLDSCWRSTLLSWAFATTVGAMLCYYEILPMPFQHTTTRFGQDYTCPYGLWLLAGGCLGPLFGALLSPHLPQCCHPSAVQHAFLDGVCINQADNELKERGIYGIGGFLSVSQELRVLWSAPYLSSLWCVFELAAYRKANPKGRIQLMPLFVEQAVVVMWLCFWFVCAIMWVGTATDAFADGRQGVAALAVGPLLPFLKALRRNFNGARKLITDLDQFDLANARCAHAFDREFVCSAIRMWYGSDDAFTEHVRGVLRSELLVNEASMNVSSLPYLLLVATPVFSLGLENCLALLVAGAPWRPILSELLVFSLGLGMWFLVSLKLLWYLCKAYAAPHPCTLFDVCKTLGIAIAFALFLGVGAGAGFYILRRAESLVSPAIFAVCTLVAVLATFSEKCLREAPCKKRPES
ncbi:unnamed protein product [Symbiodinium sp. CCMP2592]|nr:unnamed protein product [Symbiodinium sp. CCMP2592]